MSIKSDNWIRRMAAEHGMIEPFEAGQVRQVNGQRRHFQLGLFAEAGNAFNRVAIRIARGKIHLRIDPGRIGA